MPPGGDGFYYFSTYLLVHDGERGSFEMQFNGEVVCMAHSEQTDTTTDETNTSCGAIVYGTEGKDPIRQIKSECSCSSFSQTHNIGNNSDIDIRTEKQKFQ